MSTTRIGLPPGCAGFDLPDGRTLRPKELGGAVEVPERYAAQARQVFGKAPPQASISHTGLPSTICGCCGFHRIAWADRPDECPRCGHIGHLEVA